MIKFQQKLSLLVTVLLIAGCTATPPSSSPSKKENSTNSKTEKTGPTEYSLDRKENVATTPPISPSTPPSAKEASPVGTAPTLK